jgi:excisionase family DNA binding protein
MNAPTTTPPPFVDLETAARLAGCTRRTVQKKLSAGEIPAKAVKMVGRQKRVAVAALEAVFGPLQPFTEVSPSRGDGHGTFRDPSEMAELRAKIEAKDSIIASLQSTLDHERQDRAHERENWRKTLERTQGNLLAAQDTPTARAIAGASAEPSPPIPTAKPKPRRMKNKAARPWWRRVF